MSENSNTDNWQPCAEGELTGMVDHLRSKNRRAKVTRAATALCAMGILIMAVSIAISLRPDSDGLSCNEVIKMLAEYDSNGLDKEMMQKVSAHLNHCPHCKQRYEEMHAPNRPTSRIAGGKTVAWLDPSKSD